MLFTISAESKVPEREKTGICNVLQKSETFKGVDSGGGDAED